MEHLLGWGIAPWLVGGLLLVGYFVWVEMRRRAHLARRARQHHELRAACQEVTVERDHFIEQFEHLTAFSRQLTKGLRGPGAYDVIVRQFAQLATGGSTPPCVSLWLYDPANYGFTLQGAAPEAKEWLASDRLSLKEAPFSTVAREQKLLMLPQLPDAIRRLAQRPFTQSEGALLIPLAIEDRLHGLILMVCSPDQLARLQRNTLALNLFIRQASLGLWNLVNRDLAMVDHLTRVYNVAYFQERLAKELQRCHRFDVAASLLVIDIDGFKGINDTYGHQAGDWVLLRVAQAIQQAVRAVDVVARYGGDEFVVLLPEAGRGQDPASCEALPVAQRIRQTVALHPFELPGQVLRVTVSIGIGIQDRQASSVVDGAAFFKQADEQLYRAKRAGKNRCAVPDGPIVGPA